MIIMRIFWRLGWRRFLSIFSLMIIVSILFVWIGLLVFHTSYRETQKVNDDWANGDLYIGLESFSCVDRTLTIKVNYRIDSELSTSGNSTQPQVRTWINKPYPRDNDVWGWGTYSVDEIESIIDNYLSNSKYGTPVPNTEQLPGIVSGVINGEPKRFPFDKYTGIICEQNDFDNSMVFRFYIENHLSGFQTTSQRGGKHTAAISIERIATIKYVFTGIPLLVLFFYTTWVLYCLRSGKVKDNITLVSNIALFLAILSLRNFVVPVGVPFPCVFDMALIPPVLVIIYSVIVFIQKTMNTEE
jgi:hypothetical protein